MDVGESAETNPTSGGHQPYSIPAKPDLDPGALPKEPSFRSQLIPVIVIASGALIGIGSLAPWISEDSVGVRNAFQLGAGYGVTFAGPLSMMLGFLIVVFGIAALPPSPWPHLLQRASIVTGLVEGLVLVNRLPGLQDLVRQLNHVNSAINGPTPVFVTPGSITISTASLGFGYWMCGAGALLAVMAGIALPRTRAVLERDVATASSSPLDKSHVYTSRS
jgi:hypothetical protein